MYKRGFKDFLSNRKALYMIFAIVLISISTLTIVYAALSVTLNITGTADISSASWNVHLDNVNVNTQSVSGNAPTITSGTTAAFSTKLEVPGDFYEFTIDVVNDGSIDAMIESVVKTPTLTSAQAKYLKYEVEYQNGESINTRQLVKKNSFVRLKVRVEFRKDVTADVLPTTAETLNLSFTVVYAQSDGTGNNVMDSGVTKAKVISGDYDTVGSEICIQEECFYVISSDETSVSMLAKYNLYVGGTYSYDRTTKVKTETVYGAEATGIQDSTMKGALYDSNKWVINPVLGVSEFSDTLYWLKGGYDLAVNAYVYDSKSTVYNYVENYKTILNNKGVNILDAKLVSINDLVALGCTYVSSCEVSVGSCADAPSWVYSTSYWTGDFSQQGGCPYALVIVNSSANLILHQFPAKTMCGVRPVITISKSEF